jgi:hypothetical protein
MNNTAHTPGPWLVFRPENTGGWGWCIGTTSRLLARICGSRKGVPDIGAAEKQANARLIAASPELLRVLLRCREYVERAASRGEGDAKGSLADLDAVLKSAGTN